MMISNDIEETKIWIWKNTKYWQRTDSKKYTLKISKLVTS